MALSRCVFRHFYKENSIIRSYISCQNCLSNNLIYGQHKTPHNVILRAYRGRVSKGRSAEKKDFNPESNGSASAENVSGIRVLIKPLGFTVAVSGLSFGGAMIWQYETMRHEAKKVISSVHSGFYERINKKGGIRGQLNAIWNNFSPGHKVATVIISLNCGVFLLWRIPAMLNVMKAYFCSNPFTGASSSAMLLSTFSHYSFFHLAANMYVLWSFSDIITMFLGKEQFAAVYLSAGVTSSLFSYMAKTVRPSLVPSLGASGAIMAILGATCLQFPESRLSIAFIGDLFPHSFSAKSAMYSLLAFDTVGLLLGWKFFDHAAHLGGMLFGIWYVTYGQKMIWKRREKLMKWWHKVRGLP